MAREKCPEPNKPGCPWSERPGGCFADTDHVVPKRYARMGWLIGRYIHTPDNQEQLCRYEHDQKTLEETPDLIPDQLTMSQAVQRAFESGDLTLNSHEQQRLRSLIRRIQDGNAA